jgi:hypothetical protein
MSNDMQDDSESCGGAIFIHDIPREVHGMARRVSSDGQLTLSSPDADGPGSAVFICPPASAHHDSLYVRPCCLSCFLPFPVVLMSMASRACGTTATGFMHQT